MGKVETKPLGCHKRPGLFDMITEYFPQRAMKKVGCRVVPHNGFSSRPVHNCPDRHPGFERSPLNPRDMEYDIIEFLRVEHLYFQAIAPDNPLISDLTS